MKRALLSASENASDTRSVECFVPPDSSSVAEDRPASSTAGRSTRSSMLDQLERRLVGWRLWSIGDPPIWIVLWNGEEIAPAETADHERPRIVIHSRPTLRRVLLDPFFQFPEGYADGEIEIEGNLERLAHFVDQSASKTPRRSKRGASSCFRFCSPARS